MNYLARPRLTLLQSHSSQLEAHLDVADGANERAAVVLFKRIRHRVAGLEDSDRFISVEVIIVPDEWIVESSPVNIRIRTEHFREIYRRCNYESLVFGFAHSHSSTFPSFSNTDTHNEISLMSAICNRNGAESSFVALLRVNHSWEARVRSGAAPQLALDARHILVIGSALQIHGVHSSDVLNDSSARQEAAFGKPFVHKLNRLRVGVIGCSGTGSPTAIHLARGGILELVVIDPKSLKRSNLNRVSGSTSKNIGINKAFALKHYIESLGLDVNVASFDSTLDENPQAVDAITTCDIIMGCSDDHIGREAINYLAYSEAICVVDTGLGGVVTEDSEGVRLRSHHARISTILPESGQCLRCQRVVRDEAVRHQEALRENPELSDEEAEERYLSGGQEESPGVGPFTSQAASMAVATIYDLIRPYRNPTPGVRRDYFTIDFISLRIASSEEADNATCEYCGLREVSKKRSAYRLGRPYLGRKNEAR